MLDEHFIASVEANEVKFSGEMTEAVFRAVAHEQLVFRIFRWVRETQAAE